MKRTKDEENAAVPAHSTGQQSSAGSNGTDASISVAGVVASTGAVPTSVASAAAAVRTTGRVKKPKQVYDPSDNYVSRNRSSLAAAGASLATIPLVTSPPIMQGSKDSSDCDSNTSLSGAPEQQKQPAIAPPPSTQMPPLTAQLHPQPSAKMQQPARSQPPAAQANRSFDTCQKCTQSEPKRGSGHKSNFITCKSCSNKWHFPCLPVVFTNLSLARKKFKCENCRYCQVCGLKNKDLPLCSVCVDAFHPTCHDPPLENLGLGEMDPNWKCARCGDNLKKGAMSERPVAAPRKSNAGRKKRVQSEPTKGSKPEKMPKLELKSDEPQEEEPKMEKSKNKESKNEGSNITIVDMEIDDLKNDEPKNPPAPNNEPPKARSSTPVPNNSVPVVGPVGEFRNNPVSTWTVDQVVSFVGRHYPQEANAFRFQDIDGASLLLLTRNDVINGFGLKLGQALRVFQLVMSLQNGNDGVQHAWFD
ncbi:hypothetical protein KR074_002008 [Drosophila pseudoananassae]|nr:hypothetical protein KR074_002008 [Drosophila pseudoananassae]